MVLNLKGGLVSDEQERDWPSGRVESTDGLSAKLDRKEDEQPQFSPEEWLRQVMGSDLASSTKLILVAMGLLFDADGKCSPTQETLSEMTALSKGTIVSHLKKAIANGWIYRRESSSPEGHRRHEYTARMKGFNE